MSTGEYLGGAIFFTLMLAGVIVGATLLLRRRYPQLVGVERLVAWSMLATLGLLAVHIAPLALGVLTRGTVIVAAAAWVAAAWFTPAAARVDPDPAPAPAQPSGTVPWILAALALVATTVFTLSVMRDQIIQPSFNVDAMNFHLPGVAAWIQSGSLWQIDSYLQDLAPGHYPNNGDVFSLASMLPWRSDFLAHKAMYLFLPLTGLAVYALAAEVRAPRAAALAAATAFVAIPAVLASVLGGGLVDALMLFGFAVGLLFLVRHARNGRMSELVLAGLALGVSFGTKWYAVSSVALVVVVWAVAMLIARRGLASVVRQGAALVGLIALGGGIWMLRNLVEDSNPVFPVKVAPGGITIFDAPFDPVRKAAGWTIAHYFDQPSVWKETILPQYRDGLAAPSAIALLGALTALVVVVVIARRRNEGGPPLRGLAGVGLVLAALLTIAYTVTPYTAGGPEGLPLLTGADARYWIPGLMVCIVLGAWVAGTWRRGPLIFCAIALASVAHGLYATQDVLFFGFSEKDAAQVLVGLVVLAAALIAVVPPLIRLQGRAERRALAALGAVIAAGVLIAGFELEDRYAAKRYLGGDPVTDVLLTSAGSGNRIGITSNWLDYGVTPPLMSFGPRFRNEVEYVGRPYKGVFRRFRTATGFQAALREGDYDYLVVGRGRDDPIRAQPEERWAPRAGFVEVARSPRLVLYRRG